MAAILKQEYLKRYLSNSEGEGEKKRKKVPKSASKNPTSIIVDDDITVRDIKVQDSQETNELEDVDEGPAVYEKGGVGGQTRTVPRVKILTRKVIFERTPLYDRGK